MKTALLGPGTIPMPIDASGVGVSDPGGFFGGPPLTVQDVIDLIAAGGLGSYLTTTLGGQGVVQALGTLGATETIDLANANKFWGTLDQDCTITTVGWTNLKDAQISVELIQDGTGGWTPTFSGVTWIGGTPTWDTAAGTVTHVVLFSRDGGTTIYGAVVGGGSGLSDTSLVTVAASGAAETIDVSVARTYDVTLTDDCTLTLSGAVTAEAWFVTLVLRQDGTGSRLVTWPGSVVWPGGVTPTLSTAASSVDVFTLFSLDGGTVWLGFPTGGGSGGTPATTVTDETTFGISPAVGTDTEYARQDHTHGSPSNPITAAAIAALGFVGEVVMVDGVTSPPEPLQTEDGTAWVYADL